MQKPQGIVTDARRVGKVVPSTKQLLESLSDLEPERLKMLNKKDLNYRIKYKTELCKSWEMHQYCRYGDECAFAHGIKELRTKHFVPTNYKTKLCHQFHEFGYCRFGHRCQFLHNSSMSISNKIMKRTRRNSDPGPFSASIFSYKDSFEKNIEEVEHKMFVSKSDSYFSKVIEEEEQTESDFSDPHLIYEDTLIQRPRLPFFSHLQEFDKFNSSQRH